MKFIALATLLICVLPFALAQAGEAVVNINHDNVKTVVGDGPVFMMFYTSWCGHCKNFKPIFKQFAEEVQGRGVTIGWVDCEANPNICRAYGVRGYPTALLQDNGKVYKFALKRDVQNLKNFAFEGYKVMNSTDAPASVEQSHFEAFKESPYFYPALGAGVGLVLLVLIVGIVSGPAKKQVVQVKTTETVTTTEGTTTEGASEADKKTQ